ncbi:MAG: DNA primase [Patescibacteria group bacterium]
MSSPTEQIKERLPVDQVVSSYIKLERAGVNFKARCPFHSEKTPSFIVSPSRNTYHCFGCNRGGDIFSFVEEIEGVDFKRALQILADRAGISLPNIDPRLKNEEGGLYKILDEAAAYYEERISGNKSAIEYLKGRGLSDETIFSWRIGYADEEWRGLLSRLKSKKFSEPEMEKVGLVIRSEKGFYDRFRGRIMFPLRNAQGKIVGFSGRHFAKGNSETDTAKYINTPETPLFSKSRVLFGYDRAKQSIMREDFAVLVEGQMDLILSHQAGLTNTVASSGTALTEEQVKMLKRFSNNVVMAFDGDEAGIAAAARGFDIALSLGMNVRIARMPKGVDPADLIAKDKEAWISAVKGAKHIIDFYLEVIRDRGLDERAFRLEVTRLVLPHIANIRNRIDQAHFVGNIASALGLSEEPIWEEIKKIETRSVEEPNKDEKMPAPRGREDRIRDKITGIVYWQDEKKKDERIIDTVLSKERFKKITGGALHPGDEGKENLILQAEVYYRDTERLDEVLDELFSNLELMLLERDLSLAMAALRVAEKKKDEKETEAALKQCHDVSKRINEIKGKFLK